jgi:hypothetical protein
MSIATAQAGKGLIGMVHLLQIRAPFWDTPLYQDFWAGLLVFIIGLPIGLAIDRLIRHRGDKAKRRQLLQALNPSLNANLVRIDALIADTTQFTVDRLDLTVLDATASLKYEFLGDFQLAQEIDQVRAEMADAQHMLELWETSCMPALAEGKGGKPPALDLRQMFIQGKAGRLRNEIEALRTKLASVAHSGI